MITREGADVGVVLRTDDTDQYGEKFTATDLVRGTRTGAIQHAAPVVSLLVRALEVNPLFVRGDVVEALDGLVTWSTIERDSRRGAQLGT